MLRRSDKSKSISPEVNFDILMTLPGLRLQSEAQLVRVGHQILCKLNTALSLRYTYPIVMDKPNCISWFYLQLYNFDSNTPSTNCLWLSTLLCANSAKHILARNQIHETLLPPLKWTCYLGTLPTMLGFCRNCGGFKSFPIAWLL